MVITPAEAAAMAAVTGTPVNIPNAIVVSH